MLTISSFFCRMLPWKFDVRKGRPFPFHDKSLIRTNKYGCESSVLEITPNSRDFKIEDFFLNRKRQPAVRRMYCT